MVIPRVFRYSAFRYKSWPRPHLLNLNYPLETTEEIKYNDNIDMKMPKSYINEGVTL